VRLGEQGGCPITLICTDVQNDDWVGFAAGMVQDAPLEVPLTVGIDVRVNLLAPSSRVKKAARSPRHPSQIRNPRERTA
jgi:hypothetical protein